LLVSITTIGMPILSTRVCIYLLSISFFLVPAKVPNFPTGLRNSGNCII
jgi:hypothetical protein